jgi:threonine/homoserine/homoserine lactone efflux protein
VTIAAYLAFLGLSAVLALTPGPDSLLVLRYSVRHARSGMAAAFGSALSTLVWAVLVGIGLAALIEQSAELYRVLKVIGGVYLLYLGVQAILHSRRAPADPAATDTGTGGRARPTAANRGGRAGPFAAGALSTLTNPKVGLFFLAVVPQFLPDDGSAFALTMLLGATVAAVGFAYLVVLALVAARATAWLQRPRVAKYIERVSGAILAALGIGTAATAFEA